MATFSTPKDSASSSNKLICNGALFPRKARINLTSLFQCTNISSVFSYSTKYVPRLILSIDIAPPCLVLMSLVLLKWSLTTSVLNRVLLPLLFHTFELLLGWSVFVILHNPQSIPFPSIYITFQIPVSPPFDISGSKIHLC